MSTFSKEEIEERFDDEFSDFTRDVVEEDGRTVHVEGSETIKQFLISQINGVLGEVIGKKFAPLSKEYVVNDPLSAMADLIEKIHNLGVQRQLNTAKALGFEPNVE